MSEERKFVCSNCDEITKITDYPFEESHLYEGLEKQGLCETCARMTEEERKTYAITVGIAKEMVETRLAEIDTQLSDLEAQRKALIQAKAQELALNFLEKKKQVKP